MLYTVCRNKPFYSMLSVSTTDNSISLMSLKVAFLGPEGTYTHQVCLGIVNVAYPRRQDQFQPKISSPHLENFLRRVLEY